MTTKQQLEEILEEILEDFGKEYVGCEDEKYYTEGASNIWAGKRAKEILAQLLELIRAEVVKGRIEEDLKLILDLHKALKGQKGS